MRLLRRLILIAIVAVFAFGVYSVWKRNSQNSPALRPTGTSEDEIIIDTSGQNLSGNTATPGGVKDEIRIKTIAEGLDTPWALAFLPDGNILVTERKGSVRLIRGGVLQGDVVAEISAVKEVGEGGLQGIAVHPDYRSNSFVYLYYTYQGDDNGTLNRVSRFSFNGKDLEDETIVVDGIPGAMFHNGGRIKFGPDNKLYITTGDAQEPSLAQNTGSLAGKILRVNDDGSAASGNPFDNRTFSYGHRNPQGITWDQNGQLWSTEHGPSGLETGNDEFNKIDSGKNYGWPVIKGKQTLPEMVLPMVESGRLSTWAPAGLAYWKPENSREYGRFFFAGLRGSALYEISAGDLSIITHFKGELGRIREVIVGPDGMLYITTSNNDGRGTPMNGDDKVLRVNPYKL